MHPRPSIRVEEGAPGRPRGSFARAAVLAGLLALCACGGSSGEVPDAASRLDSSVVETGLAFDDAPAGEDAAVSPDAALTRDGGLALCRGSCNPVRGAGCEPGQVCALRGAEASCETPARGARGEPCTSTASCALGLACFRAVGAVGVCDRICCPGGSDCGGSEVCGGDGSLVDGTVSSWGRCQAPRACALLEPAACAEREACYVVGSGGETECLLAGTGLEGDGCAAPNDCAAGLVCAGAFERTCTRLCRLGLMEDPCGAGAMCVRQAYTPETVGVCVAASAARP